MENKISIILIEDSELNQKILKRRLSPLPNSLHIFGTAEEGIEFFEKEDAGIILMDIYLPGISGIEAAKKIRNKSKNFKKPLIFALTGSLTENEIKDYKDSGMNDYLDKTFTLEDFIEKVEKHYEI